MRIRYLMRYNLVQLQNVVRVNLEKTSYLRTQGFLIKLKESLKSGKIGVTTQQFTFLGLLNG